MRVCRANRAFLAVVIVRIKLSSGQDFEGQVAGAGPTRSRSRSSPDQEFFNATIAMSDVAAVIVRAPGK